MQWYKNLSATQKGVIFALILIAALIALFHQLYALIFYVLLGAVLHLVDSIIGTRVFRVLYNATHGHNLPADRSRGMWFYNTGVTTRLVTAISIAALWYVYDLSRGHSGLLDLLLLPLGAFALLVGFYCGPVLSRLWGAREKGVQFVQDFEAGKVDIGASAKTAGRAAAQHLGDAVKHGLDDVGQAAHGFIHGDTPRPTATGATTTDVPPVVEPVAPAPAFDHKAALDNYTKGRRNG